MDKQTTANNNTDGRNVVLLVARLRRNAIYAVTFAMLVFILFAIETCLIFTGYISVENFMPLWLWWLVHIAFLLLGWCVLLYTYWRVKIETKRLSDSGGSISAEKIVLCSICSSPVDRTDTAVSMRCKCGKTYHRECASRLKICPMCGEVISA